MKILNTLIILIMMFIISSCRKPYDVPEHQTVETHETAFLIPLEDDTSKQVKLDSEESYKKNQVMTKRIQITKRWNQTGRFSFEGNWIPNVKLVKVDRSPVTREWTADTTNGTSTKNEAIWVESSDSVGFSTGFSCTAYITENNSAKFLGWYPNDSLAKIMDQEVRNRIQQSVAETSAKYNMDKLREKKAEIIADVRKDVIPFFEERGVTISTIGMFGGFTYENPDIQKSIDAVFISQQEKSKEQALLDAMGTKKQRMLEEGTAIANTAREVAKGEADAVLLRKEAEAKGISLVNQALEQAKENILFVQIKSLEVESERIQKWNGNVPQFIMGGESKGFVPMIQLPEIKSN